VLAIVAMLLGVPLGAAAQDEAGGEAGEVTAEEAPWECKDYSADPSLLLELEEAAGRGALTQEQVDCLEDSYARSEVQTVKDKISRVLLVNAYAYETAWWAQLVQRHLDEVDRSDPNIAYLYSFYLFNRLDPDYEAVIKWTDVALERRQEWTGKIHVHRTYKLLEARTYAAYKAWEIAEEARSPDSEDLRNRVKTFAREWLDFATSSGKDQARAEAFCVNVASRYACGLSSDPNE